MRPSFALVAVVCIGATFASRTASAIEFQRRGDVNGSGILETPGLRMRLTVGGAAPYGATATTEVRALLGPHGFESSDPDADGLHGPDDNCPFEFNPDQTNVDDDDYGAACDCDDDDDLIRPDATELAGDLVDQNCDGKELCYVDGDDDGYRLTSTVISEDLDCSDSGEAVSGDPTGDCDDSLASVHPGATEELDDGIDQDCDFGDACYRDEDNDGYRALSGSVASVDLDCLDTGEGQALDPGGDCDDTNAAIKPGATELAGDLVDQNCDGAELCYVDADDDGYRLTSTMSSVDLDCSDTGEAVSSDPTGDCNDASDAIKPGATEVVDDGIDQNCDGGDQCYKDGDDDGHRDILGGTVASTDLDCSDIHEAIASDPADDCVDDDGSIYPGAEQLCGDDLNNDCDHVNWPSLAGTNEGDDDFDGVSVCEGDLCPAIYSMGDDTDYDGFGDECDVCPYDPDNDYDGDELCGDVDPCPWDPTNEDPDEDGECGDADFCPNNPLNDRNNDGICDGEISCAVIGDADNDLLCDDADNCPNVYNPYQYDYDDNGVGDDCEDLDEDGVVEPVGDGEQPAYNPNVYAGAPELCDGIDNDGDSLIDEGTGCEVVCP